MRTVVNINELADQVLEHVSSAEEAAREKTAAENAAPSLKTEIGAAFAKVAEQVRSYTPELTYADLKELQKEALLGSAVGGAGGVAAGAAMGATVGTALMPGVGTALGGIYGAIKGGQGGAAAGNAVQQGVGNAVKAASPIGNETRKLAQELRRLAARQTAQQRCKAAQVLTAGVGLAHLLKDVS